jgi:hypothetical protein
MSRPSAIGAAELRKQHRVQKLRGRSRKGKPNYTTRLSREAIVEALCLYGENGKGKNAMVGFCLAAIRKDIRNGVTMLSMITPKQVDAVITRTDITYRTLAELDADLASHGLPTSQEVFKLDYKGSAAIDPEELAIIDSATEPSE